jgi:hypothetical protein
MALEGDHRWGSKEDKANALAYIAEAAEAHARESVGDTSLYDAERRRLIETHIQAFAEMYVLGITLYGEGGNREKRMVHMIMQSVMSDINAFEYSTNGDARKIKELHGEGGLPNENMYIWQVVPVENFVLSLDTNVEREKGTGDGDVLPNDRKSEEGRAAFLVEIKQLVEKELNEILTDMGLKHMSYREGGEQGELVKFDVIPQCKIEGPACTVGFSLKMG